MHPGMAAGRHTLQHKPVTASPGCFAHRPGPWIDADIDLVIECGRHKMPITTAHIQDWTGQINIFIHARFNARSNARKYGRSRNLRPQVVFLLLCLDLIDAVFISVRLLSTGRDNLFEWPAIENQLPFNLFLKF
jgi:hypothetical protein